MEGFDSTKGGFNGTILPKGSGGGGSGTSFGDLGYSQFSATETYAAGDVVIYNGSLYKFTAAHTGAWTGTDATATSVEELIKDGGGGNGHSPYIGQNGNWYEWDEETKQFVDTEMKAQGPQGPQGEQGIQGPAGSQGEPGEDGQDGADAVNPFKGWLTSTNDLPTNPHVGDYAYIEDNGTTYIYRCTTEGSWPTTSTEEKESSDAAFASAQLLNNVRIDDTHLSNPVGSDETNNPTLAKAEDVMQLKAKLEGVTASEEKVQLVTTGEGQNVFNGTIFVIPEHNPAIAKYEYYVWPDPTSYKSVFVPLNSSAKYVRFLGRNRSVELSTGFLFLNIPDGTSIASLAVNGTMFTNYIVEAHEWPNNGTNDILDIKFNIPDGANYFVTVCYFSSQIITESNFYCYIGNGDSVLDMCSKNQKIIPAFVKETLTYYISATSNTWKNDAGTDVSGKFFDVQQYRGKYIKFYDLVKTGTISSNTIPVTSSYAFTTTTDHVPSTVPSYCEKYRLTAICEEGVLVYIPNDANYIWIYTRRNALIPHTCNRLRGIKS